MATRPDDDIVQIPLPLPHIGSVNAWLLRGDPLTLRRHGPARRRGAERRSRPGCARAGVRHRGHRARARSPTTTSTTSGLAATIAAPLGRARSPRSTASADYGERYDGARRGRPPLLARAHAPPRRARAVIADNEGFWDFIRAAVRCRARRRPAGRRRSRSAPAAATCASWRGPGHSTTDTLFVDERERHRVRRRPPARPRISSNTEIYPARRARRDAPARARRVPRQPAADGARCRSTGC